MNVRGLQIVIVVGMIALGAAPSFGSGEFPAIGDVVVIGGHHPNVVGSWVVVSIPDYDSSMRVVNRDGDSGEVVPDFGGSYLAQLYAADNSWSAVVGSLESSYNVFNAEIDDVENVFFPAAYAVWANGSIGTVPNVDPYGDSFPDWESAAVKIPLGFGMGMAFWALAASLIIPIKWAKDLTSAAS